MKRPPVLLGDGTNSIAISDHPTQPDSAVVRIDGPAGQRGALVLGEPIEEHVHDWRRDKPVCQVDDCTRERPEHRDCAEPHVCDFDADDRCLHCSIQASPAPAEPTRTAPAARPAQPERERP